MRLRFAYDHNDYRGVYYRVPAGHVLPLPALGEHPGRHLAREAPRQRTQSAREQIGIPLATLPCEFSKLFSFYSLGGVAREQVRCGPC